MSKDTRAGAELEQVETVAPDMIHNNKIDSYVVDFIDREFPNLSPEELKKTRQLFPMLIQYLYNNYIGDLLGNKHNSKNVYKNIELLDNLFNIYIDLVNRYKWNNRPSILEFSILTGINRDTFYSWLNGNYDNTDNMISELNGQNNGGHPNQYITREYTDTVAKWVSICEQALVDGSGDTIKEIFLLKAKHGYRDNNNDIQITVNHKPLLSADVLPSLLELRKDSNN